MSKPGTMLWSRRDLMKSTFAAGAAAALPKFLRGAQGDSVSTISSTGADSLRAHAQAHGFFYGAAVVPALLDVDGMAAGHTTDGYTTLVAAQANILVAENAMKWAGLRPSASSFDFSQADRLLRFAAIAGQRVRGHNLCWHEGLPGWFRTTANKDNARQLLVDHIQTVAGRYKGKLQSWDVVNEAIDPKGGRPDGLRITPWLGLVGPDYIELAFRTAAAADPVAKLTYNDYDIELDTPEQIAKRGQVMVLLRRLKARNVPIHAVGVQSHLRADGPQPGSGLTTFIRDLRTMGLEVFVTEMDVNTRGIEGGPEAQDYAVAQVYRNYLSMVLAEPNVPIALTWGITDAHTWLNESKEPWAARSDGARQRPLPFDDDLRPTPTFVALRAAIDTRPIIADAPVSVAPQQNAPDLYKPFAVKGSPGAPAATPAPLPPPPAVPQR